MSVYTDKITDQHGAPISGAQVFVYTDASMSVQATLVSGTNPLISDEYGDFTVNAADGTYFIDVWYGGRRRWQEKITIGTGGGIVGAQVTTQAGTAYTAALADANSYIRFTNGSAITFTIPPNGTVPFAIGTVIEFEQAGAGALSAAAGAGVTVNSRGADLTLAGQFAVAAARKTATNTWTLTGDL